MLPNDNRFIDERMLTSYLLGELSEEETERLDELCIADDEIAFRIDAIEAELVDAHVRGELTAEESARVSAHYAATARRREKIEFARALARTTAGGAFAGSADGARGGVAAPKREFSPGEWLSAPRLGLQWGFATAALVIAALAGYLYLQNRELLGEITAIQAVESSLDARQKDLQAQIAASAASEKPDVAPSAEKRSKHAISSSGISAATVLLMPQLRGAAQPVGVLIEREAAELPVRLGLESAEFSRYTVTLRDPATGKVVWASGRLSAEREAALETVAVGLPGKLLKQQNYSVELNGVPASGQPELISTYIFHAFLR